MTGQTAPYPTDAFISPVKFPILLGGSFAEPRSNHFHAGIDIKPSGSPTLDPIYAIADGQITRVQVDAGGYGNSLLVRHDNGFSSLFAHLDHFSPQVDRLVEGQQYANQTFEIVLTKLDSNYRVRQGELIGYMGNSGYSFGAHLHFEIRRTADQHPLNPMLFGIKPSDNRAPSLQHLRCYELDQAGDVLGTQTYEIITENGKNRLDKDTIIVASKSFDLSIEMLDKMNGAPNKNGVYRMDVYQDDQLNYSFKMDEIDFDYDRHMNMHIDYAGHINQKDWYHYCHQDSLNKLPIYSKRNRSQAMRMDQAISSIKIIASDFHGNESELVFWIQLKQDSLPTPKTQVYNYQINKDSTQVINIDDRVLISFPPYCFRKNTKLLVSSISDSTGDYTLKIGRPDIPVFKPFELRYFSKDSLTQKDRIILIDKDKKKNLNCGIQDSFLVAKVRSLGDFRIVKDTIAPSITLKEKTTKRISFEITDNLEPSGGATDLKYKGYINDRWVLFKYDLKDDLLFHDFVAKPRLGDKLKLSITDAADNTNTVIMEY